MMEAIEINEVFSQALQFVTATSQNIFLTGKAGTGKTTLLKYIKNNCGKQMAVVAPTGVAAINAGGTTMHSFFQLPFSPFIPGSKGWGNQSVVDKHQLLEKLRLNKDRRTIIQELELLVIDEISMVRCDTLDAIDTILRSVRGEYDKAFGGVQLLLIGDMFQLPPVIPHEEWKMLREYYASPYFFDSKVMENEFPVYIELDKIYRQNESRFIEVLNQVRNNILNEEGLALLHSRFLPNFEIPKEAHYITLTTHNAKADAINQNAIEQLNEKAISFFANVEGEFAEHAYPAEKNLLLKKGAQVMFLKNDIEKPRKYFNGKIGVIKTLSPDKIEVECDDITIDVKKETWRNIRYKINNDNRRIEEEELGSFSQYPLRLAWAITIHKSQGLTFEKAVIDAGAAFAPGQVYVALSRCTSLQGMVLKSQISSHSLFSDQHILHFSNRKPNAAALQQQLVDGERNFEQLNLQSIFSFDALQAPIKALDKQLKDNELSFIQFDKTWAAQLQATVDELQAVASKFHLYLLEQFALPSPLATNTALQERLKKASVYFSEQLLTKIKTSFKTLPFLTEHRPIARLVNNAMQELYLLFARKHHEIGCCKNGFSLKDFLAQKTHFQSPNYVANVFVNAQKSSSGYAGPHAPLYADLKALRDELCEAKQLSTYKVANNNTLREICEFLPTTSKDLLLIHGFGEVKLKQYGEQFLSIINSYCSANQLGSNMFALTKKPEKIGKPSPPKPTKEPKEKKIASKLISLQLFREGKTVPEIAAERNFAASTIYQHLAQYVVEGELNVLELLTEEKLATIVQALQNKTDEPGFSAIKTALGANYSWEEIRLAASHLRFVNGETDANENTPDR
jgi:hypothetical protein